MSFQVVQIHFFFLQVDSTLPRVCSVIEFITDVRTTFWCLLWPITVQIQGNLKSICLNDILIKSNMCLMVTSSLCLLLEMISKNQSKCMYNSAYHILYIMVSTFMIKNINWISMFALECACDFFNEFCMVEFSFNHFCDFSASSQQFKYCHGNAHAGHIRSTSLWS